MRKLSRVRIKYAGGWGEWDYLALAQGRLGLNAGVHVTRNGLGNNKTAISVCCWGRKLLDYRLVAYCIEATQKQDRRKNEDEGELMMTGLQSTIMLCHHIVFCSAVSVSLPPHRSSWNGTRPQSLFACLAATFEVLEVLQRKQSLTDLILCTKVR